MITFICALPQEAKHLRNLASVQNGHTQLICSGVGPRNAERATRKLLAAFKPTLVISTGVAGALSPSLRIGDVIVAAEVVDDSSGQRFACTRHSALSTQHSALLSVSHMITSAAEKKTLGQKSGAIAVDMESAAIARLCLEHGVPFAAIRAISDTAEEVLPEAVTRFFNESGGLRPVRVLVELLKQPSLLRALRRLQVQTTTASESLCRLLQSHPM
ncbi:MAG: hypothetical protein EXS18_07615 [Verrucomicrobiae bacterium]|nr:hypothetical protein [Verrucomicrobiae bacterium]